MTALGGTLHRDDTGSWRWGDGTPEPRVRDLSPDRWSFRCRTDCGGTFVEVLRGAAMEAEALAWVLEGARAGRFRSGRSGDHAGPRTTRADGSAVRAHIRPGEDPLLGHEPLPEAPGPIPAVILVPIEEWDAWTRAHPAGVAWDRDDEDSILETARSLGWTGHGADLTD